VGVPAVTLRGTRLVTSALGVGCAGLYGEPSATHRMQILDAARSSGIRHFDVAPMYGLGLAERELGRFARKHREQIVIATKFGIAPTAAAQAIAPVQTPFRLLMSAFPALRRRARANAAGPGFGRLGALLYRASGYDAAGARASLERSLRELKTDYVDLLLLHDPQPGTVRGDDVCAYLQRARDAGLIRAWGIAGEPGPVRRVSETLPVDPAVLQVRDDPLACNGTGVWREAAAARITFGVLGRSIARIVEHVGAEPQRCRRWREGVGADCADTDIVAALLLKLAMRRNEDGVVLFSTTQAPHVRSAALAIEDGALGGDDALDAFADLLDAELRPGGAD
jgi:D-threo-aldose 1-dehydrogenase